MEKNAFKEENLFSEFRPPHPTKQRPPAVYASWRADTVSHKTVNTVIFNVF